jgi:hypothetical protein
MVMIALFVYIAGLKAFRGTMYICTHTHLRSHRGPHPSLILSSDASVAGASLHRELTPSIYRGAA